MRSLETKYWARLDKGNTIVDKLEVRAKELREEGANLVLNAYSYRQDIILIVMVTSGMSGRSHE